MHLFIYFLKMHAFICVHAYKFNNPLTYLPPFVLILVQSTDDNEETGQTIRMKKQKGKTGKINK